MLVAERAATSGIAREGMVQLHHPFAKYLGGDVQQLLESLPSNLHEAYHIGLREIAPVSKDFNTSFYRSLPKSTLNQIYNQVKLYTIEFDETFGTHLYDAMLREGFPKNL